MTHQIQPRRFHAARSLLVAATILALFGMAWWARRPRLAVPDVLQLDGQTMGTVYSIRVVLDEPHHPAHITALYDAIEERLAEVNASMSLWDPGSELSRFNAHASTQPFPISEELARVVELALDVAGRSGGAFDPTVAPLVNLWGFGPDGRPRIPPAAEHLAETRENVGFRHLHVRDGALQKDRSDLQLDLGAIAKGHGVDEVAHTIRAFGFSDYLVEIGGDLFAAGLNAGGKPWRIGVDTPSPEARPGERLHGILGIRDAGVATSGDYRNYYRAEDGTFHAHILDPRTGRPVRGPISSVTVVAPNAVLADALATALFVLGPDAGTAWLEEAYPEVEALFLTDPGNGRLVIRQTPDFAARTGYRRTDRH